MKNIRDKIIARTRLYLGICGIIAGGYGINLASKNISSHYKKANSSISSDKNVLDLSSHASKEIASDIDYDGKMDVLERDDSRGHFLFYKKGYGPSQNPGIECKIIDETFFEDYDKLHFQRMQKGYYGITNREVQEKN